MQGIEDDNRFLKRFNERQQNPNSANADLFKILLTYVINLEKKNYNQKTFTDSQIKEKIKAQIEEKLK